VPVSHSLVGRGIGRRGNVHGDGVSLLGVVLAVSGNESLDVDTREPSSARCSSTMESRKG
jgi:hypothetical protein